MATLTPAQLVAAAGLVVAVAGLAIRGRATCRRPAPVDHSPGKGNLSLGVLYAFTLGMAPWTKESTRIHALAYLRGVGFHLGIFAGLLVLAAWPWWSSLSPGLRIALSGVLGAGAVLGAAGSVMRVAEHHLRALSTIDDHVSIWLVTGFLACTAIAVWQPRFAPAMFVSAGVMFAYIPLGKIRHCLYFFFARRSFGRFVGHRGVLPHGAALAARSIR